MPAPVTRILRHRLVTDQRGTMLLVALLVLLALATLAMTAATFVTTELNAAGNVRRGTSAFRVTEGGAYTALAFASSLGASSFASSVSAGADAGTGKATWQATDMVTVDYFDLDSEGKGSFGYEGAVQSQLDAGASPADFWIDIVPTGMRQPLVGYSFTGPGSRCRFKYRIDSRGNVGDKLPQDPGEAESATWQQIRTYMYIGPLPCDLTETGTGSI